MVNHMSRKYGLSETEYELMDFFWNAEEKQSFKQILEYFNDQKEKNWKKQTLSSFLKILQDKELIGTDANGKKYLYYALHTREQHIHQWVRGLVRSSFDNSMKQFLTAFSGGEQLSEQDVQDLKDCLKKYEK